MSDTDHPSTTAARVLVQELAAHGVQHVVLAPGSRSAPLAHALAAAAEARTEPDDRTEPDRAPDAERESPGAAPQPPDGIPQLDLHVRIDERAAGFLALGLAKAAAAEGRPQVVAVVTTSGTAVANLHPAVLEAHHSGVPLLLLTADRPHELRGTGANQTTDQVGIFAAATRYAVDVPAPSGRAGESRDLRQLVSRAVAAALGTRTGDPGPVHLNLAFRDPLVPDGGPWPAGAAEGRAAVVSAVAAPVTLVPVDLVAQDLATVVVAGDGAGPVARELAEARGWPLLAEPSSGARGGPSAVPVYRALLGTDLGLAVRRAVVLGRPTLSRPVQQLLARPEVQVVVVAPGSAPWVDPSRRADLVLPAVPPQWLVPADVRVSTSGAVADPAPPTSSWAAAWRRAGAAASAAIDAALDEKAPDADRARSAPRLTGPQVARAVARATTPDDVLVVGSSNPVRDLDLVAVWERSPIVLANRGLAGIDGTVSTAVGVALAAQGRRVRALMGDLTFLHDVGGLLHGPLEAEPDLQVVVVNDDGGSIFATLEHGEARFAGAFERVFGTPHGADLAALCAGYGVRHQVVRDPQELDVALAVPGPGLSVVEVRSDRSGRRALGRRLTEVARAAAQPTDARAEEVRAGFAADSQET